MGDLDVSLISEFAKRPGFYDRNDINFKDKLYVQRGWNEISNQLGYDVHMLKDRIYQLRNRYNLEKRRLEVMRHDSPNIQIDSPWPLFSYLTFLDGHIRQRRSYKTMMRRNGSDDQQQYYDNNSNNNSNIDNNQSNKLHPNVMAVHNQRIIPSTIINTKLMETRQNSAAQISITSNSDNILIKDENDSDQDQSEEQNGEHYFNPANYLAEGGGNAEVIPIRNGLERNKNNNNINNNTEKNQQEKQNDVTITTNGNSNENVTNLTNGNNNNIGSETNSINGSRIHVKNIESLSNRDDSHFLPPSKRHRRISRSEKYDAFGKFLSHSFCDLEEDKALKLVEKFTTEVVRALIENHNKNNTNTTNIN